MDRNIEGLATLIRERNRFDADIARVIGRPAERGHIGEFVAGHVFNIRLEQSATQKGYDGRFAEGPLAGRSVNIKFYGKLENILDIRVDAFPDYYLVLTGPKATATTSVVKTRPMTIAYVFLFDAASLVDELQASGVKLGVATSVRKRFWKTAEVFPSAKSIIYLLSEEQRRALALFATD